MKLSAQGMKLPHKFVKIIEQVANETFDTSGGWRIGIKMIIAG
jgi:hypothetical protein